MRCGRPTPSASAVAFCPLAIVVPPRLVLHGPRPVCPSRRKDTATVRGTGSRTAAQAGPLPRSRAPQEGPALLSTRGARSQLLDPTTDAASRGRAQRPRNHSPDRTTIRRHNGVSSAAATHSSTSTHRPGRAPATYTTRPSQPLPGLSPLHQQTGPLHPVAVERVGDPAVPGRAVVVRRRGRPDALGHRDAAPSAHATCRHGASMTRLRTGVRVPPGPVGSRAPPPRFR